MICSECIASSICQVGRGGSKCNEFLKRAEALKPSHNTGSPKLPTYGEVVNEVFGDGGVRDVPGQEANSVRHAYDFICRQLRAGA